MNEKHSGSYYTPNETIAFALSYITDQNKKISTILEPCFGDGRFIDYLSYLPNVTKITGIELYKNKITTYMKKQKNKIVTLIHSDFLKYANTTNDKFNLIIGNPPYINIKNMSKQTLKLGKSICLEHKLPENIFQNIWVGFLLASIELLISSGSIFFILPNEFLQVQYAEKLRLFLETKFNTIHVITFKELMFPKIEQETCLVYLTNNEKDLPYILYKHYEELNSTKPVYESRIERNKPLKKWSNAILSDCEHELLSKLSYNYSRISELIYCAPGIVTAANREFILSHSEVKKYQCDDYVIPIISKAAMVRNEFEISDDLLTLLSTKDTKLYLLNLYNYEFSDLPKNLQQYLSQIAIIKRKGIELQNSYKCSRRKKWYGIQITQPGPVLFFKRYDIAPRVILNPNLIHTTDIAYNIKFTKDIDPESFVFCFYNSFTLAQCEFSGRYYAGGVSELTPNEFRSLSLPYRKIDSCDLSTFKTMIKSNEPIYNILSFVNSKTLNAELSLNEIQQVENIRKKLLTRRR
ncbi:Eco57I restriction-modification methylase domain-containing protein [Treponema zuelzerae]|uniref:site-specific DNA-methyltransferase (adenine-specific) n=1 Tax=Teretinema zuelzerae TaxID=156 RepID=A0AAE3EIU9_9SPIR|nr:Eco57I restriction-modification methylase domain-containing protein [Teretinema zuelzerae]MCD1655524.1 Eco57I restriction-modification methylase domain-containing protein [Teretinema zuelzerae]